MKCRNCGTSATSLMRFCPGCGERLLEIEAVEGQVLARPTARATGEGERYLAVVRGGEPCRVSSVIDEPRAVLVRVEGGREAEASWATLVKAAAEEREWFEVS